MPNPRKSRRALLFWIVLIFLAAYVLSAALFCSSRLGDEAFSRWLDRRFPAVVELKGVRWEPWAGAGFDHASLGDSEGKKWLQCGGGRLKVQRGPGGLGLRLFLSDALFSSDLFQSLPVLPIGGDFAGNHKALRFKNPVFFIRVSGPSVRLRILKMQSPALALKGSAEWERGHLTQASLWLLIPAFWAERLPDHWGQRLSSYPGNKKILKCAYRYHHLSFYGRSGPLLHAAWSPES